MRRPAAMGAMMSPFLLLDEMGPVHYGPGEAIGAPDHPHRGFETVTYMLAGAMKHGDNKGNTGLLGPGSVQSVSYTHLRAHETRGNLVCRLLLEKKNVPQRWRLLARKPLNRLI